MLLWHSDNPMSAEAEGPGVQTTRRGGLSWNGAGFLPGSRSDRYLHRSLITGHCGTNTLRRSYCHEAEDAAWDVGTAMVLRGMAVKDGDRVPKIKVWPKSCGSLGIKLPPWGL